MDKENSHRTHVIGALFAGIIVGVLSVLALLPEARPVTIAPQSTNEQQRPLVAADLSGLADKIDRLEQKLGDSHVSSQPEVVASIQQREVIPQRYDSPPNNNSRKVDDSSAWITVLDKDVAQALVERGLTPFDAGVQSPVHDASEKLREAEEACVTACAQFKAAFLRHETDVNQYSESCAPFESKLRSTRKTIIRHLDEALDALRK